MTSKTTLKIGTLLSFLLLLVSAVPAQTDNRISATWNVERYDITANVPTNSTDRNLGVRAAIFLKNVSSSPAATITFRISPDAEIASATINGTTADFSKGQEKVGTGTLQRVILRIPSVQPGGTVTAAIDYKLAVKENSGVGAMSPVAIQFLPMSFWYPTPNSWFFARGADYAPFKVSVAAPSGLTVISSGAQTTAGYETKNSGQPFFVAADLDRHSANGVEVFMPKGADISARTRAEELVELAADAKTFMAEYLGAVPDSPVRIVAAKRGAGFAGSGTILVDANLFRRSKIDSQTALSVAEGISKMWIGSSIGVSGDGSGAIREGLPRYLATEFIARRYGDLPADAERVRQRAAYAAVARNEVALTMLSPLDGFYFAVASNKGAMIWRLLEKKIGREAFVKMLAAASSDKYFDVAEIRAAVPEQKEFLDNAFDAVADTNLLVGLPVAGVGETKVALRNAGTIDTTVNVEATLDNGEKMVAPVTLKGTSFGEVAFKTPRKIVRVEIDPEKFYPQTNYTDDIAPREVDDSDMLVAVKRAFDRQEFGNAEKLAKAVLADVPGYDDVRILLARSLLGLGRNADAAKEFTNVLNEKLPAARSLAWAHVGLAEIAESSGQKTEALRHANEAILGDADYGASLAARRLRTKLNIPATVPEDIKAFFASFDAAARANRKADIDALMLPGEAVKFASGLSGQTTQWRTDVLRADMIDANTALVETMLEIKLLDKEIETGMAVYRVTRSGGAWKLSSVDIFEVR